MNVEVMPSRGALIVRAIVNIILGALVLTWPGITLLVLVFLVAFNILFVGLFMILEPAFDKKNPHMWLTIIMGAVALLFGFFLLGRPELAVGFVSLIIAFWAIIFGVVDLYAGISTRRSQGAWLLVLTGIIALAFGTYMLFNPIEGALTLVWVIGLYAVVSGVFLGIVGLFAYPKVKGKK